MTLDDLKKQMGELGYRWQEYRNDGFKVGLFWKRVQTKRPCALNDKDQITVEVFDYEGLPGLSRPEGASRFSLTADLTGEFPLVEEPQWAKLQVYGLTPEQFIRQHKHIEEALIRAWEALA